MADAGGVELERRADGVAVITLANGKVNALSSAVVAGLRDAARALTDDPPGAVVVTGGEKIFAAGADISEFGGPAEAESIGPNIHEALDAIAAIPRFVIAAVSGYALGGGCELALACDYRIAGERAVFGQPEILLGIIPGGGGTQRLARLIGPTKAKDLIWTGRHVRADEALAIGLVDRVVPVEGYLDAALDWAGSFAPGAVVAMGLSKRAVDGGLDGSLEEGLDLEKTLFRQAIATEDAEVGIKSFFENGPGKATFKGR